MISTFDKCIFIHIPKTAGQSIESVFLSRAGLTWAQREKMLLSPNSDPAFGPPRLAHLTATEYVKHKYLTATEFNDYYRFSFVRNPWDRLVSEYRYKQHAFSFKKFLFDYFPAVNVDDYCGYNGIYRHVMPQYLFLYDKKMTLQVDKIGKFESLLTDFSAISKLICGQALQLPHINKTTKTNFMASLRYWLCFWQTESAKHYSDYYDDETQAWVAHYYAKDIALFDYQFEHR
jgi:hypothetical protein